MDGKRSRLLLICGLVVLASQLGFAVPVQWEQNGHYYELTESMSWSQAEEQAIQLGGHLVTINDREEELWLRLQFGSDEYFWIGFNDINAEGNWEWVSGEPVTYTNWWEWEPNNEGANGEIENAAIMNWGGAEEIDGEWFYYYGDGWNDNAVDNEYRGIMEINLLTAGVVFKDEDNSNSYDASIDIPIVGATVKLILNEDVIAQATTDENGSYSIGAPSSSGYTLEVSRPADVTCYDPVTDTWDSKHSTIQGREEDVSSGVGVDIPVTYRGLNYGPENFVWELWHYGPIFEDHPNIMLVHGTQVKTWIPKIGTIGEGKIQKLHDDEFNKLDDLLQKRLYGQFNVWEFEYADRQIGSRYWTHGSAIDYGGRLANAIDYVGNFSNPDINIISHSLGGLVARYAAQNHGGVDKIITLDTGHFGFEYTKLGTHLPVSVPNIILEMQPGSEFLWNLDRDFISGQCKILSIAAGDAGNIGIDFVSETSASLVQCGDDGGVISKADTYFAIAQGTGHGSIKNINSDTHETFKLIVKFLHLGSVSEYSPTGTPYLTVTFNGPPSKGYPNLWFTETVNKKEVLRRVSASSYDVENDATGYYAVLFRIKEDLSGEVPIKIEYDRKQYVDGWLTQGQSVIMTEILAGIDFFRVIDGTETEAVEPNFESVRTEGFITDMEENLQLTENDSADTGGENAFDIKEAIGFMLFDADEIIGELGPDSFNNEESAFQLTCSINDVFTMLDEGMYIESLILLENDILKRIDGCANNGYPDVDDWIKSMEGQALLYPRIVETIELLEGML